MSNFNFSKKSGQFTFGLLAVALSMAVVAACAPVDEKVGGGRFGGSSNSSGSTVTPFGDHASEYSRSMLMEVADVTRQLEAAIQMTNETVLGAGAQPAKSSLLKLATCKTRQPVETVGNTAGNAAKAASGDTLVFTVNWTDCTEQGPTFNGQQRGDETSIVRVKKVGTETVADDVSVEGTIHESVLIPNDNKKDSLRVQGRRLLHAVLVDSSGAERVYRASFESFATYTLDLKSIVDAGSIRSEVFGFLTYDVSTGKITKFKTDEEAGVSAVWVASARTVKSGGPLANQEFKVVVTTPAELSVDLGSCALPSGVFDSQYTVRWLTRDRKTLVNLKNKFESVESYLLDKNDSSASPAKIAATMCSSDAQFTLTEFYAGLLY